MAHAAEEAAITAAQEAKHAAAAAQELMLQARKAAEKASRCNEKLPKRTRERNCNKIK